MVFEKIILKKPHKFFAYEIVLIDSFPHTLPPIILIDWIFLTA